MMLPQDPWFWSVDDLVAQLCRSTDLFNEIGYTCTEPEILIFKLKARRISGHKFLTDFNEKNIGEKLGIQDAAQAAALMGVITLLRKRSQTYPHKLPCNAVDSLATLSIQSGRQHLPEHTDPPATASIDEDGRKRKRAPLLAASTTEAKSGQSTMPENENYWSQLLLWENKQYEVGSQEAAELIDRTGTKTGTGVPTYTQPTSLDDEGIEHSEGSVTDEEHSEDQEIEVEDEQLLIEDDTDHTLPKVAGKLDSQVIINLINNKIVQFTMAYIPGLDPIGREPKNNKLDPKELWDAAEEKGQRKELFHRHDNEFNSFRDRLNVLCDKIMELAWNAEKDVLRMCGTLEQTVQLMEHAYWLASIYRCDNREQVGIIEDCGIEGDADMPISRSTEIIDLGSGSDTMGEDEEDDGSSSIATPGIAPTGRINGHAPGSASALACLEAAPMETLQPPRSKSRVLNDGPEMASILSVRRWNWQDLVYSQDRKRIVSKAVYELETSQRESMRTRLRIVPRANIEQEIFGSLKMLAQSETKMPGVLPKDLPKIILLTKLYLSWWLSDNYMQRHPTPAELEEALSCLQGNTSDFITFNDYLRTIMETTFSEEAMMNPQRPSQSEIIEISDDEDNSSSPARRNEGLRMTFTQERNDAILVE